MPTIREGDEYRFTGQFTTHPKFGLQFKFTAAELILPNGRAGVARYLSQITAGVGVAKAHRIVEALGDDALTFIQQDPAVLEHSGLSFLTSKQKADIAADLTKNTVQAELAGMLCRPGSGIGMGTVSRIMTEYGEEAVNIVKENPYILTDIYNIGFTTADTIAQSVGIEPNSPFRVEAAIDYLLRKSGNEGHVFLKPNDIVLGCIGPKGLLEASGVDVPMIAAANGKLIDEGKCVRDGDAIYTKELYRAEINVAAAVRRLAGREKCEVSGLNKMIDKVEKQMNNEFRGEK